MRIFRELENGAKGRTAQEAEGPETRTGAGDSDPRGSKLLGVSRKTYYEWEERSLEAMADEDEDILFKSNRKVQTEMG